ncbi:unnamed protein product [Cuscuta campestris]|uniref:WRKY domain-containing protein n=1 Tax=Cuscuta campestris TaxID=132261 RepID=A0A484KRV8_9ASTE|nr:unnamed protein product [Cuscuta campestris]
MDDTGGSREQPCPKLLIAYTESSGGDTSGDEQRDARTTPAGTSEEEEAEVGGSDSEETLDVAGSSSVQLYNGTGQPDSFDNSSPLLLSEVPIQYSFHPPGLLKEIKEASTVQSKLELSPTSVTQSILSIPSPTLGEQRLLCPRENMTDKCMQEVEDNQKSSCPKLFYSVPVLKIPPPDGYMYNWRKYGQKQVKSPHQGSRSYYRCTYSDCHAKKIEYSDHMHRVTETVYRNTHNHEPPQKVNIPRETKHTLSPSLPSHDSKIAHLNSSSDAAVLSILSSTGKKHVQEPKPISQLREHEPTRLNDNPATNVKGEDGDGLAQNKRLREKNSPKCSEFLPNPDKKAKMVVHVSRDVGISSDGYKWRKYGQKMVKGNPHPRNYYRCTSAGCPVRKHMERAVGNSSVVIITYKDVHDHEMPMPKKPYDPPTALPLVPTTAQWPVEKDSAALTGEKSEQEGEPNANSGKSLLSIGFEIKPC